MVHTSLQFFNKDSISIRPQKREVLLHILSGRDSFINLSTGFRKRVIFELALLCFDSHRGIALGSSRVLIVLPLISLLESFRQRIQLPEASECETDVASYLAFTLPASEYTLRKRVQLADYVRLDMTLISHNSSNRCV